LPTADAITPTASQPAYESSTSSVPSSLELTSTDTPVQPLLQTLPQPLQPNQQVQPIAPPEQVSPTVEAVTPYDDLPKEEVIPLAQLPTQPPQAQPISEPVATPVLEPSPVAPAESVPVPQQATVVPEKKIAPPVEPEVVKPAVKSVSTSTIGAGAQERKILSWSPSEYTIQLLGVSSEKAARDFVAAQANKTELLVFKSKRQGKDWFVVITGRFPSSGQARQGISALPASQREAGPWPRDLKTIQNEIKAAK
jgi:DamX protein